MGNVNQKIERFYRAYELTANETLTADANQQQLHSQQQQPPGAPGNADPIAGDSVPQNYLKQQQQHPPPFGIVGYNVGSGPLQQQNYGQPQQNQPMQQNYLQPQQQATQDRSTAHPYSTSFADPNMNASIPQNPLPMRSNSARNLGLRHIDFINVHRRNYPARIELLQGPVEGLSKADETDLLVVYLRERGEYKGNRDSALAAINRCGISLSELEKATKPQKSYRQHYHCWLSRPIQPRPPGFEYKRLLVYEDPGEELTKDDNIALDMMKCLSTVLGGNVTINSVMLPLSGALLSPALRKHYIKAAVEVCYVWISLGLPLRSVRILLPPDTDTTKDEEAFKKAKEKILTTNNVQPNVIEYDVFLSYATEDKEAAQQLIEYMKAKDYDLRIYDGEPHSKSVRERGLIPPYLEAVQTSRVFIALLSDEYFQSMECAEMFSLAHCRDFESQGDFLLPIFWRNCDLTPLATRLVATEGADCREASFKKAKQLIDEMLTAFHAVPVFLGGDHSESQSNLKIDQGAGKLNIADNILMAKDGNELLEHEDDDETISQMFFSQGWRAEWAIEFRDIIFGPRIGAGGFGEVYKAKYKDRLVAVKLLLSSEQTVTDDMIAEFMIEAKLMSKLFHPNVVQFLGASIHSPNVSIVLEFMPGGSLYRAIHRRKRNHQGPFAPLKLAYIALGIAKGMAYLHSQDPVIVHRDLKTPNVLLGTNVHEVKVTDFGLSRFRVDTFVNTGPGGTPEWMAPEMLRQEPFNESSDVFSFGVILWELMVCEKPWRDDHPMQIVFKVGSRGARLTIPPEVQADRELVTLMTYCFNDPPNRPTFNQIVNTLGVKCQSIARSLKSMS